MSDISNEDLTRKIVDLLKSKSADSSSEFSNLELSDDSKIQKLEQKVSAFLREPENFEIGDIVRWKRGLKNRKLPKENQPCVVIEVLENPIIQDARDSGTPYYREPLDLILALLDDDSDLVLFHYDKRRFELIRKKQ